MENNSTIKLSNSLFVLALLLIVSLIQFYPVSPKAQTISINPLMTLPLDTLGVIDDSEGGLSPRMWHGTPQKMKAFLYSKLPTNIKSRSAQKLLRKLLFSQTTPDQTVQLEDNKDFITRLELLLKLGEHRAIQKLVRIVPTNSLNSDILKINAQSLLLESNYDEVCKDSVELKNRFKDFFWEKLHLFCLSLEGKRAEIELSLKLLEEEGKDFELGCCEVDLDEFLLTIADDETIKKHILNFFDDEQSYAKKIYKLDGDTNKIEIKPFEFTLLQASKAPFIERTLYTASPAILKAISLHSYSTDVIKIMAAEMALQLGSISYEELSEVYNSFMWVGGLDAALSSSYTPHRRAAYFQSLNQNPPSFLFKNTLNEYDQGGIIQIGYEVIAPIFKKMLENLPNEQNYIIALAKIGVVAGLATGDIESANQWYKIIESYVPVSNEAEKIALKIRPIIRGTVPTNSSWDPAYINDWWLQSKNVKLASRLFSVVQSYNQKIPADAWLPLLKQKEEIVGLQNVPSPVLLENLRSAANENRLAETVLLTAIIIGADGPSAADETVLSDVIIALRKVGLEEEAREIALEAIINNPEYRYE